MKEGHHCWCTAEQTSMAETVCEEGDKGGVCETKETKSIIINWSCF